MNKLMARRHVTLCLFAGLTAVAFSGCAAIDGRFRKDIVAVATFVDKRSPWLNFDDPPRDIPGGIKIPLYLTANDNPLGVFGDGALYVDMYRVDHGPDGTEEPQHLKRWTFNTKEAYLFGTRKKQRVGWGYQLMLNWGDVDVLGKEAMFIVSFKRYDGRIIRGKRIYVKVPREV